MRIVIDMQGAQTESRFRGIGRYSLSLALALVRHQKNHEIILALNGLFPETIEPIRIAFDGVLPQRNIRVWDAPGPTRETQPENKKRREIAEKIREAFILSLEPDLILITSLFEGYGDDAITSIGQFDTSTPTAVILYDLIPLLNPDENYKTNTLLKDYYRRKIESLKKASLLLAISESAKKEGIEALGFTDSRIINISGACDEAFTPLTLSDNERSELCQRFGITKPFVMYAGGADERKNLFRLIEAYAALEPEVKKTHQLVFVGKMPVNYVKAFHLVAKKYGLLPDDLIVTGYVEDRDLHQLYSICRLFVFPSTHEGFGIPPLEAMSSGAPVIGSHATSLSEVIGMPDALFDPFSIHSIRDKLNQVLTDEAFRTSLIKHGLAHARTFSWEASAKKAIDRINQISTSVTENKVDHINVEKTSIFKITKQKILLIKLDHLGDFILAIPAITRLRARYPYAEIDVVVGSWCVEIARSLKIFNKIFTFDFFKKKSSESASVTERHTRQLLDQLAHRYDFAIDLRRQRDSRFLLARVNAEIRVGYESFDQRIDDQLQIVLHAHPDKLYEATPLNETPISVQMMRLIDAMPSSPNDYVSFPVLGEQSTRLKESELHTTQIAFFPKAGNAVKEWSRESYIDLINRLLLQADVDLINVYFASEAEEKDFRLFAHPKLRVHAGLDFQALASSLTQNVICIANNSFGAHIGSYLGLTVIAIYGGHETVTEWAPIFNTGYVIHHPVSCSPCHIAQPSDCQFALRCLTEISVDLVHAKVKEALASIALSRKSENSNDEVYLIENKGSSSIVKRLIHQIGALDLAKSDSVEKLMIAKSIAMNHPPAIHQIFVDVSELIQRDAKSGIQRVVRSVLRVMLDQPPPGFNVVPVYAVTSEPGYRKATRFTQQFIGNQDVKHLSDDPILYASGDIFLGLDLHPQIVKAQRQYFQQMRSQGVSVQFVVYDMLCATMPQHFVPGSKDAFVEWVEIVAENDGAICISNAVAEELRDWISSHCSKPSRRFDIGYFHLGADIKESQPTRGLSDDEKRVLRQLEDKNNFLMVGTLEPRKGHAFALAAFEQLWKEGVEANLIIVGKKGWMIDQLVIELQQNPQVGQHLFWMQNASDEFLQEIYILSKCLLVASEGEGFGLPLIEAAHYQLPIIARDLPVFREVAGEHAYYYSGEDAQLLAEAIKRWLDLYQNNLHPSSKGLKWLTWEQSTKDLLSCLIRQSEH